MDNSDPIFVAIWIASRGKAYSFLSSISLYTTVTSRFCADIVYLIVHLTLADTLTKLRLTFVSLLVAHLTLWCGWTQWKIAVPSPYYTTTMQGRYNPQHKGNLPAESDYSQPGNGIPLQMEEWTFIGPVFALSLRWYGYNSELITVSISDVQRKVCRSMGKWTTTSSVGIPYILSLSGNYKPGSKEKLAVYVMCC